jgi:hypothetical protein
MSESPPAPETARPPSQAEAENPKQRKVTSTATIGAADVNAQLGRIVAQLAIIEDQLSELALSNPDELGELLRAAVVIRRGRRLI